MCEIRHAMTTSENRDEQPDLKPLHAHDYEIKMTTLSHIRVF